MCKLHKTPPAIKMAVIHLTQLTAQITNRATLLQAIRPQEILPQVIRLQPRTQLSQPTVQIPLTQQ